MAESAISVKDVKIQYRVMNKMSLLKAILNPKSTKPPKIEGLEMWGYYNGTGITTASIEIKTHDRCYQVKNAGVKTLVNIEKYNVDILGNIFKAPYAEREGF